MFSIKDGSVKSFENGTVKLLAKEAKWTSLEVRTQHTFLENLLSKYDTGPVKLPGPLLCALARHFTLSVSLYPARARFSQGPETFWARKAIFSSFVPKNGKVNAPEISCAKETSIPALQS